MAVVLPTHRHMYNHELIRSVVIHQTPVSTHTLLTCPPSHLLCCLPYPGWSAPVPAGLSMAPDTHGQVPRLSHRRQAGNTTQEWARGRANERTCRRARYSRLICCHSLSQCSPAPVSNSPKSSVLSVNAKCVMVMQLSVILSCLASYHASVLLQQTMTAMSKDMHDGMWAASQSQCLLGHVEWRQ